MASHRDGRRERRERTRLLIEYGGLVVKAGLPDRVDDDRATLLGGFLGLRDQLDGLADPNSGDGSGRANAGAVSSADLKTRWRRRGLRAFDADVTDRRSGEPPREHQPEAAQRQRSQREGNRKEPLGPAE